MNLAIFIALPASLRRAYVNTLAFEQARAFALRCDSRALWAELEMSGHARGVCCCSQIHWPVGTGPTMTPLISPKT